MKCPPLNSHVPIKLKQTHEYKREALKLRPMKTNGGNINWRQTQAKVNIRVHFIQCGQGSSGPTPI